MQLSPIVRLVIGALSVGVSALSAALAAYETIPLWLGIVLAVATPMLNFLLAPAGLGGTQQGIVNPTLTEPPAADVAPAGQVITPPTHDPYGMKYGFWPVAALPYILGANEVGKGEAVFWIGLLLVVGCLIAAAVIAYRTRDWLIPLILVLVAIVAAVLLL